MCNELIDGLYNLNSSKKWIITIRKVKYLFVGSETDCRLMMNDMVENENNWYLDHKSKGSMRELKSLKGV